MSRIRQAVILAAGAGRRMGEITRQTPKPMIKISGKPLIGYVLDLLVAHGFDDIGINLFYLPDQIKNYLGNGSRFGCRITYVEEKYLTGTAGGVLAVAKKLKPQQPFLVISAKMLVNFNLSAFYKFHLKKKSLVSVCCYQRPKDQLQKSGVVLFDNKSYRIKKFIERPQTDKDFISQWVNSSVYMFDPAVVDLIPDQVNGSKVVELSRDVFPILLKKNRRLFAYPVDNGKYYQLGIDTPDRISRAEADIQSGKFVPILPG
ncbi:nucleotidyltransferase family protein [Candidatus Daviesbacteria bacterium]|nr:nucleotidyltransferase family protein [Candidatus Daviesbacteria bacterium]